MHDMKGLWRSVLGELEVSVTRGHYLTWLKPTYIVSNEAGRVVVGVPNIFNKQWLENKYHGQIKEALAKLDGQIHSVEYRVVSKTEAAGGGGTAVAMKAPAVATTKAAARTGTERLPVQTSLPAASGRTNLNPRYVFDTFVVGSSNDFAHAAAQAVAKSPGTKYNPLFIYGGVGLGKTHLMQAVGNEIVRKDPTKKIEYTSSESFTNEFINAIQKKKNSAFTDKYRNVDVLIIDDMQFLAGKEKTQDEFFHTFNALHQANKQIIISSDKPPAMLMQLEDRLRSRFAMGITVDIQTPDLETRSAIIQAKAQAQGVDIPLEAVDFMARHAQSNIRELEGILTKVLADCEHNNSEPTLHRVQQLLVSEAAGRPKLRPTTAKAILERVAGYYDVSVADLCGAKRDKDIVGPRQVAMYLMRDVMSLSYPKIAAAVGGRDHTTAIHSVTKIEKQLESDENLRADLQSLRERLSTIRG